MKTEELLDDIKKMLNREAEIYYQSNQLFNEYSKLISQADSDEEKKKLLDQLKNKLDESRKLTYQK